MTHVPHLKYLELQTPTWPDVGNGYFLQRLVQSLIQFHFKFDALIIDIDRTLATFRTPFWLEDKHWFVGYLHNSLFSIPYFTPTHTTSSSLSSFHSTAPSHAFLSNYLHTLTFNGLPSIKYERLMHIKTLILTDNPNLLHRLQSNIDFHRVEHVIVLSFHQLATMIPLIDQMPQLTKLTIKENITMEMIERIRSYRLTQIRALELEKRLNDEEIDCIVEELFHLFPHLEQLRYKSTIESVARMLRLINGFPCLSNALFYADPLFFRKEEKFCRNPELIIEHLQDDTHHQTICRIYHSKNTQRPFSIHWTIEKPVRISLKLTENTPSFLHNLVIDQSIMAS